MNIFNCFYFILPPKACLKCVSINHTYYGIRLRETEPFLFVFEVCLRLTVVCLIGGTLSLPVPVRPLPLKPLPETPSGRSFPMAALEQDAKPEAVTPTPAGMPPPDPEVDVPSAAADVGQVLQPWEQHAAVINLPRYDYRASGSLLLRSCSGFLITCPISACPLLFSFRFYFAILASFIILKRHPSKLQSRHFPVTYLFVILERQ